jgi:hypothetical protein
MPTRATGALVFGEGEAAIGSVLLENGRICWAVSQQMRTLLTDILRSLRGHLSRRRFWKVYIVDVFATRSRSENRS